MARRACHGTTNDALQQQQNVVLDQRSVLNSADSGFMGSSVRTTEPATFPVHPSPVAGGSGACSRTSTETSGSDAPP